MLHGRPRHPQSQGSVNYASDGIKKMLTWIKVNKKVKWSDGLKLVDFYKNMSIDTSNKQFTSEGLLT